MSKKNKVTSYSSDSEEMIRMVKVLAFVVITFVLFYFVFAVMSGEIKLGGRSKKEAEIQNVEILAGDTFNKSESNYYVMYYRFGGEDAVKLASFYDLYNSTVKEKKIYLVDLDKKFNTRYLVENKSEVNVSEISKLKIVDPILVEVNEGKGISYTIGTEEIEKVLFNK